MTSLQWARKAKVPRLSVLMLHPQERCPRLMIDQASRVAEVEEELKVRELEVREPKQDKV